MLNRRDLINSKKAAGHKVDLEDVRILELSDPGSAGPTGDGGQD